MKRRGFFKAALVLVGLKALGADKKLLPNPDWVDAERVEHTLKLNYEEPSDWVCETRRYRFEDGKWKLVKVTSSCELT